MVDTANDMPEDPLESEKSYKPDDADLGQAFINRFAGQYAFLWGEWHRYSSDLGIWDGAERVVRRDTLTLLSEYKNRGIHVTRRKAENVLDYAELYLPPDDELPDNPDLIPLKNGVFNIVTGHFMPHSAENYFKTAMDFDYEPNAQCPVWEKTLESILVDKNGKPDWELILFVQQMFGYSLWGDNRLQASFFLHGEGGTGKSTVLEVLQSITNSHMAIDLETLNEYQFASLVGVRVVVFNELEDGASFPEAAFKRLVSSDRIEARFPHGRPFTFQPICTVIGTMNALPRVKDRSRGVFRRVFIVPFNKIVDSPDVYLPVRLMKERAGIFQWAMNGLRILRNTGKFNPPVQVVNAVNEWRFENDYERQFLNSAFCTLDVNEQTQARELYNAYKTWAGENGLRPKGVARVAKDWERLGLTSVKTNGGYHYWQGVKVNLQTVNLNTLL